MRRWDHRLVRLFRALIACTALLVLAPGGVPAVEPIRDVSAWLAQGRVERAVAARAASPAPAPSAQPLPVPPPAPARAVWREPSTARGAGDQRYLYLDLQTLRC